MVVVDDSCLQANSQPKSRGLVWGSTAAWRCSTFIKWTEWTLAMTLWSWWQHYKHCHWYYCYYYLIVFILYFSHVLSPSLQSVLVQVIDRKDSSPKCVDCDVRPHSFTYSHCIDYEICYVQRVGYHEVPVEPLVPNKPVYRLITDESASSSWQSGAQLVNSTITSNVTVTTANESTVLVLSAIISIISTLAAVSVATVIFCLVSKPPAHGLHCIYQWHEHFDVPTDWIIR